MDNILETTARAVFEKADSYAAHTLIADEIMANRMGLSLVEFRKELPHMSRCVLDERFHFVHRLQTATFYRLLGGAVPPQVALDYIKQHHAWKTEEAV